MVPFFFFDIHISSVELNKPRIEYVSSITTIQNNERLIMPNCKALWNTNIAIHDFQNVIGTTIVSTSLNNNFWTNENNSDSFQDDFDIVIKLPITKTISKKVKIQSISKYKPNVII